MMLDLFASARPKIIPKKIRPLIPLIPQIPFFRL
jgi:hypothetical protein